MKINIIENNALDDNEIILDVQHSDKNKSINEFIEYLNYYELNYKNKVIVADDYTLLEISMDFIRISKNCIVNIRHVKKFDISETGKIIVKLDDNTEQIVSRRRTSEIMKYLEGRRI